MHLLLFLHPDDRFITPDRIDQVVSAELPNPALDPSGVLCSVIRSNMVHGPCGTGYGSAACMQSKSVGLPKSCVKHFPKPWQNETVVQENGYPLYRRKKEEGDVDGPMRVSNSGAFLPDNRWVVPYNPYLSWRYKAHINVEVCASIKAVKYIHKYIYKGNDRATLELSGERDEVKRHLQGRYIGPVEACWNLFEFRTHEEYPAVYRLQVHLPN